MYKLSDCCKVEVKVNSSDEGTIFYVCSKCDLACDVYQGGFMLVKDSIAAQCRYGEFVSEIYGDWKIILDYSKDDYQGQVKFLATKKGKYLYLQFEYGSCSGCDLWESEELLDEQIKKEIESLSLLFDNENQLLEWLVPLLPFQN